MIWIMLATLSAVFIVGYRVLTSRSRRAVRRLASRLGVETLFVESLINQLGQRAGEEFVQSLSNEDEGRLKTAAVTLLIWQTVIVNPELAHQQQWIRCLQRGRLAAPISDGQLRQACHFLRDLEPDRAAITEFKERYNALFSHLFIGLEAANDNVISLQ